MTKLDHIAIATNAPEKLSELFERLGLPPAEREVISSQGVEVFIINADSTKIELIVPLSEEGSIRRFIAKRGGGLHHISLQVEDIYATLETCRNYGYVPLTPEPSLGAGGKLISFLDPRTTGGVLIELSQIKV